MKNQTFEEFLREWHASLFPQLLDDDMPDHFDTWLEVVGIEKMIEYGELYGRGQYLAGQRHALIKLI